MKHMNRPTLGMIFQPSRTLITALCTAGLALTACTSADDASKSNAVHATSRYFAKCFSSSSSIIIAL